MRYHFVDLNPRSPIKVEAERRVGGCTDFDDPAMPVVRAQHLSRATLVIVRPHDHLPCTRLRRRYTRRQRSRYWNGQLIVEGAYAVAETLRLSVGAVPDCGRVIWG